MTLKVKLFFLAIFTSFLGHSQAKLTAEEQTNLLLINELENEQIHNAFIGVYSPSKNIDWNFAVGEFSNGEKVSIEHPFYSASIGKSITATAIAILNDQKKLDFSDKISLYLSDSILNDLHAINSKTYINKITISQLLQHTSGIADYVDGSTIDGTPNAMQVLFMDTAKFWQPMDMINLAKNHMKADFLPGTNYQYCNTDYILLGLIIEKVSGMEVHNFFRKHIFEPLNMNSTKLVLRSNSIEPTLAMAEIYAGNVEVSKFTSLSLGWTGGGLSTTASDLNKFQHALHTNEIVKAETLHKMKKWIPESIGMYYGYGLRKIVFHERNSNHPNLHVIGHTGSTSSFMLYCPELDVYLAGTFNQTSEVKKSYEIPLQVLNNIKNNL